MMKLRYALALSGMITGTITFLAWAQPEANETRLISTKMTEEQSTSPGIAGPTTNINTKDPVTHKDSSQQLPTELYGLTRTVSLTEVEKLVKELGQRQDIYARLKPSTSELLVVYQDFSKSFLQAKVTVGFAANSFIKPKGDRQAIPHGQTNRVSGGDDQSPAQLEKYWSRLQFGPSLKAVVEKYTLLPTGEARSVDVYEIIKAE